MRHLLACILVGLLLGPDAPKDDAKKDKENLQGTWKAVTVEAAGKVQDAVDRAAQGRDNLAVAFALARYKADRGGYPGELGGLVPKYLDRVPGDLFSGKPLVYRPGGGGYVLYSVGMNGRDDGGRGYSDDPPGDDLTEPERLAVIEYLKTL